LLDILEQSVRKELMSEKLKPARVQETGLGDRKGGGSQKRKMITSNETESVVKKTVYSGD